MNLVTAPSLNTPNKIRSTPAIRVATVNPLMPYSWMIPQIITINAPVGPPICTLLPPNKEMINPATIAVLMPFSGETPEAIPNAIGSGSATIPTIIQAMRSAMKLSFE